MVEANNTHPTAAPRKGAVSGKREMRVFINDRGQGSFICPSCQSGVIKDLSDVVRVKSAVRIRCKCRCGHVYRVLVERRRYFRKQVNLSGLYIHRRGDRPKPLKGLIAVRDISQSGIGFSVNRVPEFKVGDRLIIEFTLDDANRSQVREEGVVRRIQSDRIGVEFTSTDRYGKLGQYLFG